MPLTVLDDQVQAGSYIESIAAIGTETLNTANNAITAIANGLSRMSNVSVPSAPAMGSFSGVEVPSAPSNTNVMPAAPNAPSLTIPPIPSPPSLTLPTIPVMLPIVIPSYAGVAPPTFSKTAPAFTGDAPVIGAIDVDVLVTDPLYMATRTKLTTNITDGGTMLNPLIEASIWDRDRERREQALQDAKDKATAQWAKLNWSVPDGLLAGALLAIDNEFMNKDIDASREIAIKQAEMEQAGMFKSLELGVGFETMVLEQFEKYATRRLATLKTNGDILIQVFTQQVALYNARLEGYKTDAAVYKSLIEANMAQVEVYKAEISAQMAIAQLNESLVKSYVAEMSGVESQVKVYNSQVEAAKGLFDIERAKIEQYKVQIEAYVALVDAGAKNFTNTIQAYAASIEGVKSQNQLYGITADSQAKIAVAAYQGQIAQMEANAKMAEVGAQIQVQALIAAASASSNLAAGAMAALHASVTESFSQSNTTSQYQPYNPI
jgi:phage shock protein A